MFLNCHSYYSFSYGTVPPEELASLARSFGFERICLTDINSTSGYFDFVKACRKNGITPLLGVDCRTKSCMPLYTCIAKNAAGLLELNRFLSRYHTAGLPAHAPAFEHVVVIYRMLQVPLSLRFNEFVGVAPHEQDILHQSPFFRQKEKLLAFASFTFQGAEGYQTHQLLRAIEHDTVLSQLNRCYVAHAEEQFDTLDKICHRFAAYPELVDNTLRLMDECSQSLETESPKNKKHYTSSEWDDYVLLEKLAFDGLRERYGPHHKIGLTRLKNELRSVADMGFLSYFLIAHDIIRYAESKKYTTTGRGQGSNSLLAYCLNMTNDDPLEPDLLSGHFQPPHRTNMPSFDLDFNTEERHELTDYIFKRYGSEHVAMISSFHTFQREAITLKAGKAFGVSEAMVTKLLHSPPRFAHKHHPLADEILKAGQQLTGFPARLSAQTGGILITEKPVCQYTALQTLPGGFPAVQFDKWVADDNGFCQFTFRNKPPVLTEAEPPKPGFCRTGQFLQFQQKALV